MGLTRNATDEPAGEKLYQAECLDCGWLSAWFEEKSTAQEWREAHECEESE